MSEGDPDSPPGYEHSVNKTPTNPPNSQVEVIEPLVRECLRRLKMQSVRTRLNYDEESERVDEEIEMETPPHPSSNRRANTRVHFNTAPARMQQRGYEQPRNLPPLASEYVRTEGQMYNPDYNAYGSGVPRPSTMPPTHPNGTYHYYQTPQNQHATERNYPSHYQTSASSFSI